MPRRTLNLADRGGHSLREYADIRGERGQLNMARSLLSATNATRYLRSSAYACA